MEKIRSTGLDLKREEAEREDSDWVFGAESQLCLAGDIDHDLYLPKGEVQRGSEDFMDCASRGPVNISETKFNYLVKNAVLSKDNIKWLRDNKYTDKDGNTTFSDRYIAILSGTTRRGNSIKAPVKAIHEYGLIPKVMLPKTDSMSFSQYHAKSSVTKEMKELGKEFAKRFPINYDIVRSKSAPYLKDMVDIALSAWGPSTNGVYTKINTPINHVVAYIDGKYRIFDNYIDMTDGDFIKQLAPDYILYSYGYRLFISELRGNNPLTPKILRNGDGPEHGVYIPLQSADMLKQLSDTFDIDVPTKDGKVDWDNVIVDGEVKMFEDTVRVAGNWLTKLKRLFNK